MLGPNYVKSDLTGNYWLAKDQLRNPMSDASHDQAKDTGLAILLILLLAAHFTESLAPVVWAIAVLLVVMVWPRLFSPLAIVWFGLSRLLGTVSSKVLLTLVFAIITTPIGLARRLFGADALRLKEWKQGKESVMVNRDHLFIPEDLERPY